MRMTAKTLGFVCVALVTACGSSGGANDGGTTDDGSSQDGNTNDVTTTKDAATDASADAPVEAANPACIGDTLDANRNRLLETYFEYLKANATVPQSNGLSNTVTSALDVWQKLDPSSQTVFLTLSARMQGSILGKDATSMLSHILKIYRITGGQGATANDPGSCGGGEYNRMIMSMDVELHDVQAQDECRSGRASIERQIRHQRRDSVELLARLARRRRAARAVRPQRRDQRRRAARPNAILRRSDLDAREDRARSARSHDARRSVRDRDGSRLRLHAQLESALQLHVLRAAVRAGVQRDRDADLHRLVRKLWGELRAGIV